MASIAGTSEKYPNHYSILAAKYVNCTVITSGGLEITHIDMKDIERLDSTVVNGTRIWHREPFWFLKDIEEITGYLLIMFVDAEEIKFPKLKIIRGKTLVNFSNGEYAYFAASNKIKYLTFPKLRIVMNGPMLQGRGGKSLCYMNYKVSRSEILDGNASRWITHGKEDSCSVSRLKCHPSCSADNCYGPREDQCQEIYRKDCPGSCQSCFTDEDGQKQCCDSECTAGCRGLGPDKCFACRNYLQDDVCVPKCNGVKLYDQKTVRGKMRPKEDIRYYYGAHCVPECPPQTVIDGDYCVVNCQQGYYRDPDDDDTRTCKPCPKTGCPKICKVTEFLNHDTIKDLDNCFEIEGNLQILNHFFEDKQYTPQLLSRLKSVQIITGFLNIDGAERENEKKPTSLSFLENLKVIEGREQHDHYSLIIKGMPSLTELGLQNLNKINSGKVGIYGNPNLCMADSINWRKRFKVKELRIVGNAPDYLCGKFLL